MYGLVMLTALSSGADPVPVEQPAPVVVMNCTGCSGVVVSGCYGSCHGLFHKHKHGLFGHHRASCMGCSGYSCDGWNCFGSCYGCSGSCYGYGGCHGISEYRSSCFGYGNFGGLCYGFGTLQGTPFQCHGGGFTGGFGLPVALPPYSSEWLGWGFGPAYIYGSPAAVYGNVSRPPTAIEPRPGDAKPKDPKSGDTKDPKTGETKKDGMGANLKIRVPAEARLFVDGQLTVLKGSERSFTTPPLISGQRFYYDLKAEITVNGRAVVEEKRVLVEAGADITESFSVLFAAAGGQPASVAGK